MEINNKLFTQNYTKIEHEDDFKFNAPHHFNVIRVDDGEKVCQVDFQEGPIKENGVNGVANEDLIAMVYTRLEGFQNSEFNCKENQEALEYLEKAIQSLRSRTTKRVERGVEGTSVI